VLRTNRRVLAGVLIVGLQTAACRHEPEAARHDPPARVERREGSSIARVILSAKAVERLGIQTAPIREASGARRTLIPYAALIYDLHGDTWAYTNPEPLVFVRERIRVDRIEGEVVALSDGPSPGTPVVTVGAAELFGVEFGVGK